MANVKAKAKIINNKNKTKGKLGSSKKKDIVAELKTHGIGVQDDIEEMVSYFEFGKEAEYEEVSRGKKKEAMSLPKKGTLKRVDGMSNETMDTIYRSIKGQRQTEAGQRARWDFETAKQDKKNAKVIDKHKKYQTSLQLKASSAEAAEAAKVKKAKKKQAAKDKRNKRKTTGYQDLKF